MNSILKWLTGHSERYTESKGLPISGDQLSRQIRKLTQYSEFKRIFDQVSDLQQANNFKSMTLLSLLEGEGKTLMTALMGYAFAEFLNKKILIVDAHGYSSESGLNLSEILEVDEINQKSESVYGTFNLNIDYLNLNQHIKSKAATSEFDLRELLNGVGSGYGVVLVDTVATKIKNRNNFDPLVISSRTDGAFLIVSDRGLADGSFTGFVSDLQKSKTKVFGMMVNEGVS